MKIILINTTPMDKAYELWKQGLYPGHHLWGILELQKAGFECIILQHEKYKFLNVIGRFFNIQYLDQQIRALWLLRKCDLIYAPYAAGNTKLLVILKLLKLLKKPVVIVVHQPLFGFKSKNFIKKYFIKKLSLQFDALIFLSERLRRDLIETLQAPAHLCRQKFLHLDWGADALFYRKYLSVKNPADTGFAISAGHTDRDFDTLIDAFRQVDFALKIYCTPGSYPTYTNIPENITIISNPSYTPYTELLEEYNNARMILIPLTPNPPGTQGLTSLLDVVGMGKPVIMTRNPNVDIDIDKEGIGISVDQCDVTGWVRAINSILHDYNVLKQMGKNSRQLMNKRFNMSLFSKGLEEVFIENHPANRLKQVVHSAE